jgi:hypothetical protein
MLQPFFESLEALSFSTFLRESAVITALINVAHLLALVVLAGSVLMVDLRLFGRGTSAQPLAQVANEARPWTIGALLVLLATGIPQLMSTAVKQYYSPYFWFKMSVLVVALLFTFTLKYHFTQGDEERTSKVWGMVFGAASIALWTGVAVSGRLIGLLS